MSDLHSVNTRLPGRQGLLKDPATASAAGGCGACGDECPTSSEHPASSEYSGGQTSLASLAVFLLPIVLALCGAAIGSSPSGQAIGAVAGLAVGVVIARGITRFVRPAAREE